MIAEEEVKKIEEFKDKNYLFISPKQIKGGARLVSNYERLKLYENMDINTIEFAKRECCDLVLNVNSGKSNERCFDLSLIFCGGFDDLPDEIGNFKDFIMNNKDKIVAIYRYVKSSEESLFTVGLIYSETVNKYGYIYLNFEKLVKIFEENDIKVELGLNPRYDSFDTSTYVKLSYNLNKKETKEEKVESEDKGYIKAFTANGKLNKSLTKKLNRK